MASSYEKRPCYTIICLYSVSDSISMAMSLFKVIASIIHESIERKEKKNRYIEPLSLFYIIQPKLFVCFVFPNSFNVDFNYYY